MTPWLPKERKASQAGNDAATAGAYKLSAVVMHVGGPAAGHYYAYVRYDTLTPGPPTGSNKAVSRCAEAAPMARGKGRKQQPKTTSIWVKLDDHRVTKVSEKEVLRDAFGGGGGVYSGPGAEYDSSVFGQVILLAAAHRYKCSFLRFVSDHTVSDGFQLMS